MKTDNGRKSEDSRRKSLPGGLVPVMTDKPGQPQVSASPISNKILPKSPILSHNIHTFIPPTYLELTSNSPPRNKITKENRTGL